MNSPRESLTRAIGTFGLAAVQLRNVFERRKELALLRAVGFRKLRLGEMVLLENLVLLFGGLATGTLAALVLTVHHRGQWARVLPRFSEMSMWCVIALLAGGVTGALVAVDSTSQLFATGYGRVLLVKIVLTVVLMALAWRNRARWLPAAKSHRVTAYVSRSRSLTELAIMAVALTMAAALSVTG
jgi:putative copper resistance protein D